MKKIGRPSKFDEKSKTFTMRVPASKLNELKPILKTLVEAYEKKEDIEDNPLIQVAIVNMSNPNEDNFIFTTRKFSNISDFKDILKEFLE